jgi:hypothetical protein
MFVKNILKKFYNLKIKIYAEDVVNSINLDIKSISETTINPREKIPPNIL